MSQFITTASVEFAREFIRCALPHLPLNNQLPVNNAKLRGRWIATRMDIVNDDDNSDDESVYRSVTLGIHIHPDIRLYANGNVRKGERGWDSGTFTIYVPHEGGWRISGRLNDEGDYEFFNVQVLDSNIDYLGSRILDKLSC